MANKNLSSAKRAKNDEFYTQFSDIEREVQAYIDYNPDVFRGKTVYCNCDDPYTSNFFKFFALSFNEYGLRRLIAASYDPSPIAGTQLPFEEIAGMKGSDKKAYIFDATTMPGNLEDTRQLMKTVKEVVRPLAGNGDFRSAECIELLKQADIVVTNPPFSLFREYLAQLVEHGKKFLIIGNMNAITYKEVFPLIKENKVWLGVSGRSDMRFSQAGQKELVSVTCCWYTNLDHGRRHEALSLMTLAKVLHSSKHKEIRGKAAFDKYDNYDAIEVPYTDAIPGDYDGVMGVPISFLDKYNPEQFEILGITDRENVSGLKTKVYSDTEVPNAGDLNRRAVIKIGDTYQSTYARILIRHRKR